VPYLKAFEQVCPLAYHIVCLHTENHTEGFGSMNDRN
jgi:hypothetical protein